MNLFAPKNLSEYSYFDPQKICKIVYYIHLLYFYFGNTTAKDIYD